jgi:hypothetical protein
MEFAIRYHFPAQSKMSSHKKADALQKSYEMILNSNSTIVHKSLLDEVSQICGFTRRALARDFTTFPKETIQQSAASKILHRGGNIVVNKRDNADRLRMNLIHCLLSMNTTTTAV